MRLVGVHKSWRVAVIVALGTLAAGGCHAVPMAHHSLAVRNRALESTLPSAGPIPRELDKITLPTYTIEPPDVLLIDAVKVVPKAPYHIEPLDVLQIFVDGALPDQPIAGPYLVDVSGTVNLGPAYQSVKVEGLTTEEASQAIRKHLERILTTAEVAVSLIESAGKQQITGEHLVGPDGTLSLGTYGNVYVAGMTLAEARAAIEEHLSEFLEDPEVGVDVFSYNSKVYYVITEGAGLGDQIVRLPITGNETVLDAVANINGLSRVSSKNIWISRPAPDGTGCNQVLPVNWQDIVRGGSTATNYQLMPGDRVLIAQDKMIALDTWVDKMINPFERAVGFSLLTAQTVQTFNRFPIGNFQGQNVF